MRSIVLGLFLTAVAVASSARAQPPAPLDYDTFKTRVQPIFLAKHDGYARCYVCHSQGTNFRLQRLAEGATAYTDEQTRENFKAAQRFVSPGNPLKSRLLLMPLSHDAGGTEFHPGGKRWESQSNAEWKTIADWVARK